MKYHIARVWLLAASLFPSASSAGLRSGAPDPKTTDLEGNSTIAAKAEVSGLASYAENCEYEVLSFDPNIHKRKYTVAVHAIRGDEAAIAEYTTVFADYLTATVGARYDTPIQFEIIPAKFEDLFKLVERDEGDLFYADPGVFSCIGAEFGAEPLATIVSRLSVRGRMYDLDVYGGVMFAKADRHDINSVRDFQDKIIAAGAITQLMGGKQQFYEMERSGMSYVMDPKQVVFTGQQNLVVEGVLNGKFDVGFVRTDTIERFEDENGAAIDPKSVKIIQPQTHILDDGNLLPFLHSTDIAPEWPVAALEHVPTDITKLIQKALLALEDYAKIGRLLHECEFAEHQLECESQAMSTATHCTTKDLAKLAWKASKDASLAGFRTARSYFSVGNMHELAGFMKEENGHYYCTRADTLYDNIECPVEHYKLPFSEFNKSCSNIGLSCQDGYECYCKPCVKAKEVDVFKCTEEDAEDDHLVSSVWSADRPTGCEKMSICGEIQQRKKIIFHALDNMERNGTLTVKLHVGDEYREIPVRKMGDNEFIFSFDEREVSVAVMEVFIDGVQIPESPVRVQIEQRRCELDYPGQNKVASFDGECVCSSSTIDINGKCISNTVMAAVISCGVLVIVAIVGYFYLEYRNSKNDEMWQVSVDELHFDDPAEVIGQGSFGVVLLAEYRGSKVAIKRAVKEPKNKRGSMSESKSRKARSSHCGSTGRCGISTESAMDDGATTESEHDIENQSDVHVMSISSSLSQRARATSENFSLGFLVQTFGQRSKWAFLCPWKQQEDYQNRFKEMILGGSSTTMTRQPLKARLLPCLDKQRARREEFIAEMRVLSRLRHPCITTVLGAVLSRTHDPMLVMEYMEYGSLHDLLRNDTMYLSGEIILQITRDIAQGLRYLHSSKPIILHGDLKARNILVDSRFRAKLCDFGLSAKNKNIITGTPYWLAPEYLRGQTSYNTHCDMYSVAIILFEIYSRQSPYEGENFRDVLRKVCDRRVNKRPTIPSTTPPKMVDLMKKLWVPDPFFRPQAKDLDAVLLDMNVSDVEPLTAGQHHGEAPQRTTIDMLYEIFPKHVANALKNGQKVAPETHEEVTVIFSDIVHFTDISRETTPLKVSNMLDRLYLAFDRIARQHNVFKVETIGDAYMGVTNLEANYEDTHVKLAAEFAMDMVKEASQILIDEERPELGYINIRVGFHCGSVVSNVIGSLNPRYGLFGDTVNTASRMESNSKANRILCSEKAYKLLIEQAPEIPIRKRGKIAVKGKGDMNVYWVGDPPLVLPGQVNETKTTSPPEPEARELEKDLSSSFLE